MLPFEDVYFLSYLKLSDQWNSQKYEHVKKERTRSLNYSNFRKYAHPLHVKEGIIMEKVFSVFSESFFWTCFGLVMYIWELMGVTEKFAFQM